MPRVMFSTPEAKPDRCSGIDPMIAALWRIAAHLLDKVAASSGAIGGSASEVVRL